MNNQTRATLILPCYNEAEHFEDSVKRIYTVLDKMNIVWEVIFIDDCSIDNTPQVIKIYMETPPAINSRAIYHNKNYGRGATVAEGIRQATSAIVGYIDIDCEIDPSYIPQFVEKIQKDYDVICANRIYSFSWTRVMRYMASKLYVFIQKIILGVNFPDTEAGYKFFKKEKILPILQHIKARHWFWDTEIMVKAQKAGLSIVFIPTIFKRRNDKSSTVQLFPDTIDYIKNLWRLRKELKTYESNS